jgi:hypothetical protein
MTNEEILMSLKNFLEQCEYDYFTGSFSESTIVADLKNRKAIDGLSTMGSSGQQTYRVREKKQVYFSDFDKSEQFIDRILKQTPSDHEWLPRFERCKNQIIKLRNLVQDFR